MIPDEQIVVFEAEDEPDVNRASTFPGTYYIAENQTHEMKPLCPQSSRFLLRAQVLRELRSLQASRFVH